MPDSEPEKPKILVGHLQGDPADLPLIGPLLETHARFPKRTNVQVARRIGPGEIEACLQRHPAVALAAVVGEPDPIRTEVVKAVIVLKPGYAQSPALAAELQEHVRSRLAAHEYPRIVQFAAELPLTATGKIIRRALRSKK